MTAVALQAGYGKSVLAAFTLTCVMMAHSMSCQQDPRLEEEKQIRMMQANAIQLGADMNQRNQGIGKVGPSQQKAQNRYDCGICLKRNVLVRQGKVLKIKQCSHTFCTDCLREHVKQKIREGFCLRIDCPQNGCIGVNGKRAQMNEGEIRKLVTSDLQMRDIKDDYNRNMQICNLSKESTFKYCLNCNADVLINPLLDQTYSCNECQSMFCLTCSETLTQQQIECNPHECQNKVLNSDSEQTYETCPGCSGTVKKLITSGATAGTYDTSQKYNGSISAHTRQQSIGRRSHLSGLGSASVKSLASTNDDFGENILKCTSIKCKNSQQGCTEFCYLCGQNLGGNKYFHFFSLDKCQGRLKKKYN